ncbi:MAG: ATP-binding cassette domain-containing protein [Bacteroidota bacterium]
MSATGLMIAAVRLRRSFGDKQAVCDVSFGVKHGEIFGLLGPNGAGKTTTIRLLTGQIDLDGGRALVAGCDVVKDRARLKERIGVVFEEQNLYERLSARDNLLFSSRLYGLPESRIEEVLDLVRLREHAREPVRTLSNGMKQRLMIARALLHRPPVLFLDEPTRGLDPISAREVRSAIEQLCREGTTVLLTTHLLEEADQLCQRVAFIVNGRIVANDTPRNLKLSHGKRCLVVSVTDREAGRISDLVLSMDDPRDQARLAALLSRGGVRSVHSQEATLEEVFIEVAGIRPA